MSGGTFTITNIGPLGGTGIAPIVNHPEVAILGLARARLQPVVSGDEKNYEIVPRLMLPISITFDHRVLDGAEAARFLNMIIEGLENPENLLMMI
jgi:pyruvate dehydrogenase E2 component (dihydrolipoamide acetyltransferase)